MRYATDGPTRVGLQVWRTAKGVEWVPVVVLAGAACLPVRASRWETGDGDGGGDGDVEQAGPTGKEAESLEEEQVCSGIGSRGGGEAGSQVDEMNVWWNWQNPSVDEWRSDLKQHQAPLLHATLLPTLRRPRFPPHGHGISNTGASTGNALGH